MSGIIAQIEDGMVEIAQQAVGDKVREVAPLPGSWSHETLRRILQRAPAVYAAWLGGQGGTNTQPTFSPRFALYVCTNQPRVLSRRRGSAQQIGAYELLEALVPRLDTRRIGELCTLRLQQVDNLVDEAIWDMGATVYSATFTAPSVIWPPLALDALADFETYSGTSEVGGEDTPDLETLIDLPQED